MIIAVMGNEKMKLIDLDADKEYLLDGRYKVEPLVHSKWIRKHVFNPELDKYVPFIECGVCGYAPYYGGSESNLNYCPNCGADMREGTVPDE